AQREVTRLEIALKEAAKREAALKEAAQREIAKREAAFKEAAQREIAKREAAVKEALKRNGAPSGGPPPAEGVGGGNGGGGGVALPAVIVEAGKIRQKAVKAAKRGKGKLLNRVYKVVEDVREQLGEDGSDLSVLPVVVFYRKKPEKWS